MSYNHYNQHRYNHGKHYSHSHRNFELENAIRTLTDACQAMREENEQTKQELARVRAELMQTQSNQLQALPIPRGMELYGNALPIAQPVPYGNFNQPNIVNAAPYGDYGAMNSSPMPQSPFANSDIRGRMAAGAIGLGVGALAAFALGAWLFNRD